MCPFQLFQTGFNGITDIKTLILVIKAYIDHCIQISAVRKTSQPPFNPIQVNDPFLYPLKTSTHVGGSVVVWGGDRNVDFSWINENIYTRVFSCCFRMPPKMFWRLPFNPLENITKPLVFLWFSNFFKTE